VVRKDSEQVLRINNMGFDFIITKDTDDIESLSEKILLSILRYNNDNIENDVPFYIQKIGGFFSKAQTIEYRILSHEILEDEYVHSGSWKTRYFIEKGAVAKETYETTEELLFNYSDSFQIEAGGNVDTTLDFNNLGFKTALASKMLTEYKNEYAGKIKTIVKKEITLEITNDDVVSCTYEYANVYRVEKIYMQKKCSCCQGSSIDTIKVYLPLPILKYRKIERFNDNTVRIIDMGEVRG